MEGFSNMMSSEEWDEMETEAKIGHVKSVLRNARYIRTSINTARNSVRPFLRNPNTSNEDREWIEEYIDTLTKEHETQDLIVMGLEQILDSLTKKEKDWDKELRKLMKKGR